MKEEKDIAPGPPQAISYWGGGIFQNMAPLKGIKL